MVLSSHTDRRVQVKPSPSPEVLKNFHREVSFPVLWATSLNNMKRYDLFSLCSLRSSFLSWLILTDVRGMQVPCRYSGQCRGYAGTLLSGFCRDISVVKALGLERWEAGFKFMSRTAAVVSISLTLMLAPTSPTSIITGLEDSSDRMAECPRKKKLKTGLLSIWFSDF